MMGMAIAHYLGMAPMPHHDLTHSDPKSLAELLRVGGGADPLWRPEELAAVLRHQLAAPVEFDPPDPATAKRKPAVANFLELFEHPHPPLELLLRTKDFAKANRGRLEGLLPQEVATVLYYASIVVARLRLGERLSDLDDQTVRKGIDWALAQPWVDGPVRRLFTEGRIAFE
jgi:hypothetical protein